ncbi:MAG: hypothetical protein AAF224_03285 [Pseudomonadota bacterium]
MAIFRLLAWILVALGIALLGADAISSLESGVPVIRTTADMLALGGVDASAAAATAPSGVANVLETVLGLPLWAVLGLIGLVLTLVFRPID